MIKIHPFLKGFLSNWYKSEFTVNGVKFVNSEQWMMYQKANGESVFIFHFSCLPK